MSQNAGNTAVEALQGVNQEASKRSFSADAFRALTMRLNQPASGADLEPEKTPQLPRVAGASEPELVAVPEIAPIEILSPVLQEQIPAQTDFIETFEVATEITTEVPEQSQLDVTDSVVSSQEIILPELEQSATAEPVAEPELPVQPEFASQVNVPDLDALLKASAKDVADREIKAKELVGEQVALSVQSEKTTFGSQQIGLEADFVPVDIQLPKTPTDVESTWEQEIPAQDTATFTHPVDEVEQEQAGSQIPQFEIPEISIPAIELPAIRQTNATEIDRVVKSRVVKCDVVKSNDDVFSQSDDLGNELSVQTKPDENPLLAAMKLMEATGLVNEDQKAGSSASHDHFAKDQYVEKENNVENSKSAGCQAKSISSDEKTSVASEQTHVRQREDEMEPDEETGKTARLLLDMMSAPSGVSQPQERALASDTLLQLVPRMPVKDLVALSERVCLMQEPPSLLVEKLINHKKGRVAQPLLEGAASISEQDLLKLIAVCEVDRLVMVAKRRKVPSTICDALVSRGEASVYLTLVRNPGAKLSHDAFVSLCEIAKSQPSLQAPLATRGDTPPPIAFELFWSLPVELRRYILSRFLTDSGTLDKILKIAQSVDGRQSGSKNTEPSFPPKRKTEALAKLIADGANEAASKMLAQLASIGRENAVRIIADPDGEPLTVAFKTLGLTRQQFNDAIKNCINSPKAMLRADRNVSELQAMFDSLSFNKARTLITYWDWAMEKTGPYTRRLM